MPIRFRCSYCNQLMGIARRKAGTVVRCPSCTCQVIVPEPEDSEAADKAPPPVFERADFDEIFRPALRKQRAEKKPRNATALPPGDASPPAPLDPDGFDVIPIEAPPLGTVRPNKVFREGVFLTPKMATVGIVAAVVALGLAFGAGLWVGSIGN